MIGNSSWESLVSYVGVEGRVFEVFREEAGLNSMLNDLSLNLSFS